MAVQTGHLVTSSKYARASCHRAVAQPGSLPRCGPLLASRLGVRAPTGPSALIERRRVGDEAPTAEPVKRFETRSYDAFCASSSMSTGSLIHATVGSFGGCGWRWRNRAGFAA